LSRGVGKPAHSYKEDDMAINRKVLISATAVVVALFVIAFPLGDAHHGIGKHNSAVTEIGNVVFGAFIIGVFALILLVIVAFVQVARRSRRTRSSRQAQTPADRRFKARRPELMVSRRWVQLVGVAGIIRPPTQGRSRW